MADSQASDSVYVGEISSLDVLIGIGGLLPSGPEWDGILYPVRISEGIGTNFGAVMTDESFSFSPGWVSELADLAVADDASVAALDRDCCTNR